MAVRRSFERPYRRACQNPNPRYDWRPAEELPEVIGKALQIFIDICVDTLAPPTDELLEAAVGRSDGVRIR